MELGCALACFADPKDVVEGARYFVVAARGHNVDAMGHLCNLEPALRDAAMAGDPEAAQHLTNMYREGLGVAKNRRTSNRWGKLWERLACESGQGALRFTRDGTLETVGGDECILPPPGDDLYSMEWLYRNMTLPETLARSHGRDEYAKYKAARDAGAPGPF